MVPPSDVPVKSYLPLTLETLQSQPIIRLSFSIEPVLSNKQFISPSPFPVNKDVDSSWLIEKVLRAADV